MAFEILRMIIDSEAFSNEMIRTAPMPISLKEAYYVYCYGILLNKITQSNTFLKLSKNTIDD